MRISKNKNFICILLSISLILSGMFYNVLTPQSVLDDFAPDKTTTYYLLQNNMCYFAPDKTTTYYSVKDVLPVSVSTKSENQNTAVSSNKLKSSSTYLGGFGGIVANAAFFLHNSFCSDLIALVCCNDNLNSHTVILNYIHQQDGKK